MNWYFLRYADVLLLYAEALNEWKHGPDAEAYNAINAVRRRGYGNQVTQAHAICHKDSMKQVFVKQSAKNAVMNYHLKDTVVKT